MKTFSTPKALHEFAHANLYQKTQGRKKLSRSLINVILREERKNKNRHLAIMKLLILLPYLHSDEQEDKIFTAVAQQMSKCDTKKDIDFLDYIVVNLDCKVCYAMCQVMREIVGITTTADVEVIKFQWQRLEKMGLASYFFKKVQKSNNAA